MFNSGPNIWRLGIIPFLTIPGVALGHGSLHDLIKRIENQLQTTPDNTALQLQLARVYLDHGEWQNALQAIAAAEASSSEVETGGLLRGQAFLISGQPATALRELDRHIAQHPMDGEAYRARAAARLRLGKLEAATEDFRTALKFLPIIDSDLAINAASAFSAVGEHKEAALVLDRAIDSLGLEPALLKHSADAHSVLGNLEVALQRIAVLEAAAPRPEPWMAKRAEILEQAGRHGEALAAWSALIEHLDGLPNLQRGSPLMLDLRERAEAASAAQRTSSR